MKSRFTKALVKKVKSIVKSVKKAIWTAGHKTIGKLIRIILRIDWKHVKLSVYVRWIALFILALNHFLSMKGLNPLPFSGTDVYQMTSDVITFIVFVVNTYKNNSTSKEAIEADKLLETLRKQQEELDEGDYESL